MTRNVVARLSRLSLMLVSLGYGGACLANEATLLTSASDVRYRAIGQLALGDGADAPLCTGTVVAGSASPDGHRPALVLTAGHCVLGLRAGGNEIMVDKAAPAGSRFTPAYFQDARSGHVPAAVDRVLYATTKGADLAVLQLAVTYGELLGSGVEPLVPAAPGIVDDLPVELVHVPVIDVPEVDRFTRLSTCAAEAPGRIFEAEWFLTSASRTDCAGVAGGSSGAPVLRQGTRDIVGVLGTGVDPRFDGCGWDRPCELLGREAVSVGGASYQSLVAPLVAGFRTDGSWNAVGLDAGNGVKLGRVGPQYTGSLVAEEEERVPARWGLVVDDRTNWIRYKQGDAASVDCARMDGYSAPVLARELQMERMPLPQAEGVYAMCVIGQLDIDNDWQRPEHASVMLRVIDDTPPTTVPEVIVRAETDDRWSVELRGPYVDRYLIKRVPIGATSCADDADYRILPSSFISLSKSRAPTRLCVKGRDEAGNRSPAGLMDFSE